MTTTQVPLNPGFNTNQVISALTHLGVSHLFISTETNLPRRPSRDNTPLLSQIITDTQSSVLQSEAIPSLQKVILIDNSAGRVNTSNLKATTPYTTLSKSSIFDTATLSPQNLSNEDIINIQFTSGTTSTPKAATLTHRSILNNGFQIGDRMLLTPQDIICCPPPLFHCFGCILGYMASVTHASSIIFPSESFNAAATLTTIQNEKCTALYGVPTMFIEELELIQSLQIPTSNFKTLRTGIAAGSSIPATLMKKLHQTLNLTELTICYGMTETSPVSAMTTTDDPIERRIDSVGRCMPHVKAKIVHPGDPEKVLGVGEKGELVVGGYLVMKGYWGDEKKTEEVLKRDEDGEVWMHVCSSFRLSPCPYVPLLLSFEPLWHERILTFVPQTGDEATLSAEGYISITGRIKDLIIRGGENIHPLEIENCLLSHKDVLDVAVVGIPDEKYGEVVGAFVVLRKENEGEEVKDEEMREFVRGVLSDHLGEFYSFEDMQTREGDVLQGERRTND